MADAQLFVSKSLTANSRNRIVSEPSSKGSISEGMDWFDDYY
jgi:hypothetical protein